MTPAILVNIVVTLFVIFFILRMSIDEREFFFSPLLQPIYRVTEPVLRIVQGRITYFDQHRHVSIILIILLLLVLRGIVLSFLSIRVLLYSDISVALGYLAAPGLMLGIILSLLNFIDQLFQVFFILVICSMILPAYSTNPIIRFTSSLLGPLFNFTAWLFYFVKRGIPVLTLVLLILCHFLLTLGCVYLLSLESGPHSVLSLADEPLVTSQDFPATPQQFTPAQFGHVRVIISSLKLAFGALGFFSIIIIIGAVMSWFRPDPFNPLVQWIQTVNGPILAPLRKYIPLLGGIDLSPVVALLIIELGRQWLALVTFYLLTLMY